MKWSPKFGFLPVSILLNDVHDIVPTLADTRFIKNLFKGTKDILTLLSLNKLRPLVEYNNLLHSHWQCF